MGTIADKLELLRRTKERQRAYLEQKYPLLDFDNIPFRAYLDLFQGRSYVTGFVGGWKAYGRSNDEDADTRDILPDYSGNGRDIKLYNFAFEGMSGYGGCPQDMSKFHPNVTSVTTVVITGKTKIALSPTSVEGSSILSVYCSKTSYNNIKTKLRVTSPVALNTAQLRVYDSAGQAAYSQDLIVNGDTEVNSIPEEYMTKEYGDAIHLYFTASANIPQEESISIEEFPVYPGALVSDGVDDYGQCIKDFALPDDYTVVAIRRIIEHSNAATASKGSTTGAFIFENGQGGVESWSYGSKTYFGLAEMPELFSYQTKTSYNSNAISSGTEIDNDSDKFLIFTHFNNGSVSKKAALYDLRVYDHSLTAEELQTVKDEMMTDYENATGGGIADVTYVADWDAKGRSNDEEETMRSQWTDKVNGRVINLNNYSFSEMSGWGGFRFDWSGWASDINSNGGEVIREKDKVTVKNFGENPTWTIINRSASALGGTLPAFSVRVSGLKEGAALQFNATGKGTLLLVHSDGIYSIPEDSSNPTYYAFTATGYSANEAANLVIEQLPVYPGALMSDGVDDYIKADEALGEVGSVLIHWKDVGLKSGYYLYNTGWDDDDAGRLYFYREGQGSVSIMAGIPSQVMNRNPIQIFHRSPLVSTGLLNNSAGKNNCPIFRLIFIKEQLDEYQQEFLKWKVEKEYRDWCKANGYEYATNEMLNN